ncbi:hypothetical protein AnigIFM62618_002852 [Aspergillus niger]|nr:hypothetical protein AnigIFM62618_002852 [Aspergillus niger]
MAADAAPIQQIITLFTHLNTNSARHDAYHRILDLLNPHEWRDVQKRINQRSFQKDILAELPPEIAVQIAQYLDLSDLFILQRYAKYRIRLERGLPICNLQAPNLFPTDGSKLECLDYANGRCAWLDNGTHVVVHDLCKRSTQRFCTENRDSFWDLRLSDSMVVAISARAHPAHPESRYCHAWNLETEEHASFRIPAFSFRAFVVTGLKVALSFINHSAAGDEESKIYYWDMSSRTARTIQIAPHLALIGLQPTTNSVTTLLLERGDDPTNPHHSPWDRLRVVKHTFDDHGRTTSPLLPSYTLHLPFPIQPGWTIADISDSSTNNLAVFNCTPPPQPSTLSATTTTTTLHYVLVVSYDPQRDQIHVHTLPQEEGTPYFPFCKTALDSDLLYYVKSDRGKPAIWISSPASRIPHRPAESMSLGLPREASNAIYTYANMFTLHGDRDFVLLVHETDVKVWRFKDTQPPESVDLALLAA